MPTELHFAVRTLCSEVAAHLSSGTSECMAKLPCSKTECVLWLFAYSLPFIPAQIAITTVLQQSGYTVFCD